MENWRKTRISKKTILLGDYSVGKTSLMRRMCDQGFNTNIDSTIGAAFYTKNLEYEKFHLTLQIWDTAGAERFRALSRMYVRGASICILVYDISNRNSFENLENHYLNIKEEAFNRFMTVVIVGNKLDMQRAVEEEEGRNFAEEKGCLFYEISCKTEENVVKMMKEIASDVIHYSFLGRAEISQEMFIGYLNSVRDKVEEEKGSICV